MKYKNKIAMITCYYGQFPWYFIYFIHSCKYNPSVDFFIITDIPPPNVENPENVKFIYKTLKETADLASAKLGLDVLILYPYKFCDFKPAYGVIFEDYLIKYDFWGHCDIDVIFGNIREFMSDELLKNYDVISVRADWLTGCFLLYRNVPDITKLFFKSKDYYKVFTSMKSFCFDETNFKHDDFTAGKQFSEIESEIESMTHVVKKMDAENFLNAYFDVHIIEGGSPGRLRWENGTLIYKNKFEIMMYHLIDFKKHFKPRKKHLNIQDKFYLSPTDIYTRSQQKN